MNSAITLALLIGSALWVPCGSAGSQRAGTWVLVRPHLDGTEPRSEEPLTAWHRAGTFATARDCVEELVLLRVLVYDRAGDATPAEQTAWTAAVNIVEAARCVPAESLSRHRADRKPRTHARDAEPGPAQAI
jgi:hypothetical protein